MEYLESLLGFILDVFAVHSVFTEDVGGRDEFPLGSQHWGKPGLVTVSIYFVDFPQSRIGVKILQPTIKACVSCSRRFPGASTALLRARHASYGVLVSL